MIPERRLCSFATVLAICCSLLISSCSLLRRDSESGAENEASVDSKVTVLKKELEESQNRIRILEAQLNQMALEKQASLYNSPTPAPQQASAGQLTSPSPAIQPHSDADYANYLAKATNLIDGGRYDEAILELTQLSQAPASDSLKSRSLFYLGESFLMKGEHRLASEQYKKLLLNYPTSGKTSDALLSLAAAEQQLGDAMAATKYRELVFRFFPNSPAAMALKNSTQQAAGTPVIPAADVPVSEPGIYDEPLVPKENSQ